jgi:hypothetical protein
LIGKFDQIGKIIEMGCLLNFGDVLSESGGQWVWGHGIEIDLIVSIVFINPRPIQPVRLRVKFIVTSLIIYIKANKHTAGYAHS